LLSIIIAIISLPCNHYLLKCIKWPGSCEISKKCTWRQFVFGREQGKCESRNLLAPASAHQRERTRGSKIRKNLVEDAGVCSPILPSRAKFCEDGAFFFLFCASGNEDAAKFCFSCSMVRRKRCVTGEVPVFCCFRKHIKSIVLLYCV
jgi:hypothetical protein